VTDNSIPFERTGCCLHVKTPRGPWCFLRSDCCWVDLLEPQNLKLKQSSNVSCLTCQPFSVNPLYFIMDTKMVDMSRMLVVLMAGQTVKWGISPIHVWPDAISVSFIQCYPTIKSYNHILLLWSRTSATWTHAPGPQLSSVVPRSLWHLIDFLDHFVIIILIDHLHVSKYRLSSAGQWRQTGVSLTTPHFRVSSDEYTSWRDTAERRSRRLFLLLSIELTTPSILP
jgi:hypothetical protein